MPAQAAVDIDVPLQIVSERDRPDFRAHLIIDEGRKQFTAAQFFFQGAQFIVSLQRKTEASLPLQGQEIHHGTPSVQSVPCLPASFDCCRIVWTKV